MIISRPVFHEDEIEPPPKEEMSSKRNAYIAWYLDVEPWKCHECNATMFGRMTYCAFCRFKLNKDTLRRH